MADEQLKSDLDDLFTEFDGLVETFGSEAEENRRTRERATLEQRQATVGDQPEREFEARVFLLVPHNDPNPPDAVFDQSTYSVVSGNVVSLAVELENTDTASVTIGGSDVNYEVSFTVVDGDGDGRVTVEMDTAKAGEGAHDVESVFTAKAGDSLQDLTRHRIPSPSDPISIVLGNYDLVLTVRDQETDVATLYVDAYTDGGSSADRDAGTGATAGGQPRQRPLPRRPNASPPLRSSGLTVTDGAGSRTETIEPGETYTVDVTVENAGGLGASNVTVELYVEHRTASATVDTNASGVFEAVRGGRSTLSGYTTLPPGHDVAVVGSVGSIEPRHVLFRTVGAATPVTDDRTFSISGQLGMAKSSVTGDEFVDESVLKSDTFDVRLYWTTGIDLTDDEYQFTIDSDDTDAEIERKRKQALSNFIDVLENEAALLTETSGRFAGSQSNQQGPLDLETTIDDATLVPNGRRRIRVPTSSEGTATVDYTAPASRDDRVSTVIYTRVYSLAPEDVPADWDALDHTRSRFMGRTELDWTGIAASE